MSKDKKKSLKYKIKKTQQKIDNNSVIENKVLEVEGPDKKEVVEIFETYWTM